MIAHNRENHSQTQARRPLGRYERRWVVKRLFAWLQGFRRLVTHFESHAKTLLGMVRLACLKIMLRFV